MFWSKSEFFKDNHTTLLTKRQQVLMVCQWKGINSSKFIEAYDYFRENPEKYDGATIVKDFNDIRGLDFSAMLHDYQYIVLLKRYKGLSWIKKKIQFDWEYGKNMERLGKGIFNPYLRSILLILSTPIYYGLTLVNRLK